MEKEKAQELYSSSIQEIIARLPQLLTPHSGKAARAWACDLDDATFCEVYEAIKVLGIRTSYFPVMKDGLLLREVERRTLAAMLRPGVDKAMCKAAST